MLKKYRIEILVAFIMLIVIMFVSAILLENKKEDEIVKTITTVPEVEYLIDKCETDTDDILNDVYDFCDMYYGQE